MVDDYADSTVRVPEPLTEREREILHCLAEGLSNREIANRLYLAEKTVRWYNSQIYSKLSVGSRQEAIERARALGWLDSLSPTPPNLGKHNLPPQATPFVGREDELKALAILLSDPNTRLVTILAPGGMGKTRLSLEAARLQVGRYNDGVFFVPLAPLSAASDIVTTIAETIGFSFYGENSPAQQLLGFLHERALLLVLDNFEHLLDGAPLVAELIQTAPGLRVLATSRERLNLRGETVYALRGLEFPAWETPDDALEYDAVKLFMQGAQRQRPDFALQTHDLDFLARICRLTAGMPLGIELAAGWVDVLALEQIAVELQHGIDILETEMRDVPERQRSVRATFDRTWERLTDEEQRTFMRLSVFRGGFTVDAARAVADADMRSLRTLANKALVQVSPNGRHDLHELLRQYGAEKLGVSGQRAQIQAKHAAFFAEFMAERKQDIRTDRQLEALALIDPDFENVRVAWLHTVDRESWGQFPKFLHSLWFYLDVRTRGREAVELLEHAVKALQSAPSSATTDLALGRILARLGWFYNDSGFTERGAATCDEAIRILRQHDSPEDLIAALHERQNLAESMDESTLGLSLSQEALAIARLFGDKSWEGYVLFLSAWLSIRQGDTATALQIAEEASQIFARLGDRWGLMRVYGVMGATKADLKDYEASKQWLEKALTLAEAFGHIWSIAILSHSQAGIALQERNYATAHRKLKKGLRAAWDAGYQWFAPYLLIRFARMFADQNELDRAVQTLATAYKHRRLIQADEIAYRLRDELEAKMEPKHFAAAWARGEGRELSVLVTELLAGLADE